MHRYKGVQFCTQNEGFSIVKMAKEKLQNIRDKIVMISLVVNALRDKDVYCSFGDKKQTRRLPGEISSFLTLLSKRVEIQMSCQHVHLALQIAT